jgi:hypothetical protein
LSRPAPRSGGHLSPDPHRSGRTRGLRRKKSIDNLMRAIDASKRPRLDRFLFALGIEHVGDTVARLLRITTAVSTPSWLPAKKSCRHPRHRARGGRFGSRFFSSSRQPAV